jgi:hypothetical protein
LQQTLEWSRPSPDRSKNPFVPGFSTKDASPVRYRSGETDSGKKLQKNNIKPKNLVISIKYNKKF